jgi:hypothetical protein
VTDPKAAGEGEDREGVDDDVKGDQEGYEDDEDEDDEGVDDFPSDWEDAADYPGGLGPRAMTTDTLSTHIALGTAPTTNFSSPNANSSSTNGRGTGRILSFPNWIQVRPSDQ